MKTLTITKYQCETCGSMYDKEDAAKACEAIPRIYDKGVKIGDLVRITSGDGTGLKCKVDSIRVLEPSWGPKRYAHSVVVSGEVVGSWGSRMLTWDAYEIIEGGAA